MAKKARATIDDFVNAHKGEGKYASNSYEKGFTEIQKTLK